MFKSVFTKHSLSTLSHPGERDPYSHRSLSKLKLPNRIKMQSHLMDLVSLAQRADVSKRSSDLILAPILGDRCHHPLFNRNKTVGLCLPR